MMNIGRFLASACLVWFGLGALYALPDGPRDDLAAFRLGICQFASPAQDALDALARRLPLLLIERLRFVDEHRFGAQEQEEYWNWLVTDYVEARYEELDAARTRRDLAILAGQSGRAEAAEEQELRRRIDAAREAPPDLAAPAKPFVMASALPLPAPRGDAGMHARRHDLHFMVHGRLEEISAGWVYVECSVYVLPFGRTIRTLSTAGRLVDAERLADDIADGLAEALLGRTWASLEIQSEPADAHVFLDSVFVGSGQRLLRYLRPGEHRLTLRAEGHEETTLQVSLSPFGRESVRVELQRLPAAPVEIISDPPGASVYLGAEFRGITPLELDTSGARMAGTLRLEDHRTRLFLFPPDEGTFRLQSAVIDWEKRIEKGRNRFYASFGAFLLSLPLPILLYGWYENVVLGYNQLRLNPGPGSQAEMSRLVEMGNLLYYSYFGGLFLSGSLLVDSFLRLMDYIDVVNRARDNPRPP